MLAAGEHGDQRVHAGRHVVAPMSAGLLPAPLPPAVVRPSQQPAAAAVCSTLQNSTEQLDRLEKAFDEVKARLLAQVSRG